MQPDPEKQRELEVEGSRPVGQGEGGMTPTNHWLLQLLERKPQTDEQKLSDQSQTEHLSIWEALTEKRINTISAAHNNAAPRWHGSSSSGYDAG